MEVSSNNYHFAGWVTRYGVKCTDGRTIMPDAFKHQDGTVLPLVWNHQHNDVNNVLGKVLLHNRDGGMYGYALFNDTESGVAAKTLVEHGDIVSMSICANQLKHDSNRGVTHGKLNEVSLVLAGANPGAFIDTVMKHGEECEDEAVIYTGESIELYHADTDDTVEDDEIEHSENSKENESKTEENTGDSGSSTDKTLKDIFETYNEEQKTVFYYFLDKALENGEDDSEDDSTEHSEINEGDDDVMKQNVFDQEDVKKGRTLTHSDMRDIITMAKESGIGSFQKAVRNYIADDDQLAHAFAYEDGSLTKDGVEAIETLFPDFHDTNTGAPHTLKRDQSWVMTVINKIHKSPYSRIRTRHADARIADLRAKGYQKKGDEKKVAGTIKLLSRTTDPQTVYRKDELHRDDIIDITEFDVVAYQWGIMKENMYEELALAALVGDLREDGDPDKIHETHIRPIWKDDELYTIHKDVDIAAAKAALQGTNTSANFGENYIYAEAIITAALYAREQYKGSGKLDFYCAPHLINVMLLARDLNGRRIYDSVADLAKALNCNSILDIEQLEGLTRVDEKGNTKKLLGLFVNLSDYTFGSTKGGELTKFEDFDIDFNKYKYLMETRLSGALTKPYAAIALEEPVTEAAG